MKLHLLALLLGLGGCCDSCRCAKKYVATPDKEPATELVKVRLREAKDVAKKLCGLEDADGIEVTKIDLSFALQTGTAQVEGTPIGVKLDKALVCIGAVAVTFAAAATDDSGSVTEWKIISVDVDEVKTPGHEWKKPVSVDD